MSTSATPTNGPLITGNPTCPKCAGSMWDNRQDKRNPKAPDFKCKDRSCDGALWPGQHRAAPPIITPPNKRADARSSRDVNGSPTRKPTRQVYLDVTEFVLREVCPIYDEAGVPCSGQTVAAIVATLFISIGRDGR